MQTASLPTDRLDATECDTPPSSDDTSLSTLLGGIVSDLQQLLEDHLHLLKLEVQDDLQKSRAAIIPMAIGGGLLLTACMLFTALVQGWLMWLEPAVPWFVWSGLLALGVAILGGVMLIIARRRWRRVHSLPEKTLRQVKRTIESINKQVNPDKP